MSKQKKISWLVPGLLGIILPMALFFAMAKPAQADTFDMWADSPGVAPGGATTIRWSTTDMYWCNVEGNGGTEGSFGTGPLYTSTTYVGTCGGSQGGYINRSVTVTVEPPRLTMTASPSSISYGSSSTISWSTSYATWCNVSGYGGLSGSFGTGALTSTTTYYGTCGSDAGYVNSSVTVSVSPPPTASISADSTSIAYGGSTTIRWSSTNASSCSVSPPGWGGTSGAQGTGALYSTTTYSVNCSGATASVTVGVGTGFSMSASPTSIAYGSSSTIRWSASNATWCNVSGYGGSSGSFSTGALTTTTTYYGTCGNDTGYVNASVTVTVGAPPRPTCSSATPDGDTVSYSQGTRRTYANGVANATRVSFGFYGPNTTIWVWATNAGGGTWYYDVNLASFTPGSVTVYAYMQNDWYGDTFCDYASFTIAAPAPTVDLYANGSNGPISVAYNTAITLSWSSGNASSCSASGTHPSWQGSVGLSGGWNSPPLTTDQTFTLTCSGAGGSSSDSVTVYVGSPAATADIYANGSNGPITVPYHTAVTLSWGSTNASSCSASGTHPSWRGPQNTGGGWNSPALTSSQTFTLTCSGPGGSGSDSVVVNVGSPGATVDIFANGSNGPISVAYNTAITLSWGSTNASSCSASGTHPSWRGPQNTGGGWNSPALTSNHTFTISCSGPGGSAGPDSVVVNIIAPPAMTMTADATTVAAGSSTTIRWTSSNTTTCNVATPSGTSTNTSGSFSTGALYATTTYNGQCSGSGGAANGSVTVNVTPPVSPTCTSVTPTGSATVANTGTWASTANGVANSTDVRFAVWSSANGTDDYVWYTLPNGGVQNLGGGNFRGNINLANHPGLGTINVQAWMFTSYHTSGVLCGYGDFTRVNNGGVQINSTRSASWTINYTSYQGLGPWTGTGTTQTYNNMPFGSFTITPADIAGYTWTVTPANPQTLQ